MHTWFIYAKCVPNQQKLRRKLVISDVQITFHTKSTYLPHFFPYEYDCIVMVDQHTHIKSCPYSRLGNHKY